MNFLAHYVFATRFLAPTDPQPEYVLGNALPDLLPLAAPRSRLRLHRLSRAPVTTCQEAALCAGVLAHLRTDAAFHKTARFAQAQSQVNALLQATGFTHIRVRRFFLSHILAELALDAALLREEPTLADTFYAAIAPADTLAVTRWTESAVGVPLPLLPTVLTRFQQSRYLRHYADDAGVATGINRICQQARQDTFSGENETRLIHVIAQTVPLMRLQAPQLLTKTAALLVPG